MYNAAQAAGSPAEAELIGPDGKRRVYLVFPLTDGDTGSFLRWCGSRLIDTARNYVTEYVRNADEGDRILAVALAKAASMQVGDPEYQELCKHPDGWDRLVWYALKRGTPELSFEDSKKISRNEENLRPILTAIVQVSPKAPTPTPATGEGQNAPGEKTGGGSTAT